MKKHHALVVLFLSCILGVVTYWSFNPCPADAVASNVTVEWLIKPQFDSANDFACGVAWVREKSKDSLSRTKSKWKQIDSNGKVLIDDYEASQIFPYDHETQLATIINPKRLTGYINLSGELVITPQYHFGRSFKNGMAVVAQKPKDSSLEGVIDRNGKIVLPIIYERIIVINNDLFAVQKGEKWGYVNSKSEVIFDYTLDLPPSLNCVSNSFPAAINGKVGLLDTNGKWLLPASYDGVFAGKEEPIGFEKNGKVGFVDASATTVIDFRFEKTWGWGAPSYYIFSEGLATVLLTKLPPPPPPEKITPENIAAGTAWGFKTEDVRSGVIDKNGELLFEFQGIPLTPFTKGLLLVHSSRERYGLIDRDGKLYPLPLDIEFDSHPRGLSERILRVKLKDKTGLFAKDVYGYLKINVE